jgi:hypothetical protein
MGWLEDALESRGPFAFGELHISFEGDTAVVEGPGEGAQKELPSGPEALRQWVRRDDQGNYRPLPGAKTMPTGWRIRCPVEELVAHLDAAYPLAPRQIALAADGKLRVELAHDVLDRQTGRYAPVRGLEDDRIDAARGSLCASCVKAPLWNDPTRLAEVGVVPCPEPCSVFVALCRELAVLKRVPAACPVDPSLPFAEFGEPGNATRERALEFLRHAASTMAK